MTVSDVNGRVKGRIIASDGRPLATCVVTVLKDGRRGQDLTVGATFERSIGAIDGGSTYQFLVTCEGMEQHESPVFHLTEKQWVADLGIVYMYPNASGGVLKKP
jgi:hypothetical protein